MNHPFINIATQAARAASRHILKFFDQLDQIKITAKERNDFVTEVDKMAEKEILFHIQKAYPNHAILTEESGAHGSTGAEYQWIIDPLDGTSNYIHGFPQFAISIAVKKGDQLETACIYDPISQELFTAARGKGAQLNHKRIRVSTIAKLDQALIGTGFPVKGDGAIADYIPSFSRVLTHASDVRRAGAATLDLAYVACGRLDGFWELGLSPWDMASGALLIQEAGGIITDFNGSKDFMSSGNIVAGNSKIHAMLSELI